MTFNNKALVMVIFRGLLLLAAANGAEDIGVKATDCKTSFVEVTQGPTGTLPSGTPIFTVQILNQCPRECRIAQLHLNCGSFRSEKLIPPSIFKRVGDNDCLVKNGMTIEIGSVVSFQYANAQQFPLQVSSLQCLS